MYKGVQIRKVSNTPFIYPKYKMVTAQVKVKFTLYTAMKAEKDRYSTRLSLTSALNGGRWLMPQSLYPGNDPVPIV